MVTKATGTSSEVRCMARCNYGTKPETPRRAPRHPPESPAPNQTTSAPHPRMHAMNCRLKRKPLPRASVEGRASPALVRFSILTRKVAASDVAGGAALTCNFTNKPITACKLEDPPLLLLPLLPRCQYLDAWHHRNLTKKGPNKVTAEFGRLTTASASAVSACQHNSGPHCHHDTGNGPMVALCALSLRSALP